MTPLIALFLRNAAFGFLMAIGAVAAILHFDIAGLGGLMLGSSTGVMAAGILTFFLGLTFGSVQIGIAVMNLGDDTMSGPGERQHLHDTGLRPIPVRVAAERRRR
ncbi:MAG: hypothetical protein AAF281_10245 [Pseudomonadota bacterium]